MFVSTISIVIVLMVVIGVPIGLFFAIRSLIRYNAELKKKKTQQQEEMEKMNIEDL